MLKKIAAAILVICAFDGNPAQAFDIRQVGTEAINKSNSSKAKTDSPTVRIFTAGPGGSGVIIGRNKDIYTVLTANHVVSDSSISEIELEINGSLIKPISIEKPFKDVDLATVKFRYEKFLQRAYLPFLDKEYWNMIDNWGSVRIEGFANASNAVEGITKRVSAGQILGVVPGNKDGYDFIHTAVTTTGMSGGGIYGLPFTQLTFYLSNPLSESTKITRISDLSKFASYKYTPKGVVHPNGHTHNENNWIESEHTELENKFRKACLSGELKSNTSDHLISIFQQKRGGYQPRQEYLKSDCHLTAHGVDSVMSLCTLPAFEDPNEKILSRKPFNYYLLAIHGRAEEYEYGGKSGAGLGIFLASPKISQWLQKKSIEYGVINANGFYVGCRHRLYLPEKGL